jgi:cytochrome d ubiquinol oxidase subunit II
VLVTAGATLLLATGAAPHVSATLIGGGWAAVLQLATAVAAVMAIGALWTRRYRLARVAAGAQVSCILWGWAWAQFPYIVPPTLTIGAAAAPPVTLRLVLIALGAGSLLLLPSLWYLFRVFKASGPAFEQLSDERR